MIITAAAAASAITATITGTSRLVVSPVCTAETVSFPPSADGLSADKPAADGGKDTASAVQTGDTTNLLVPAIVAVIALAAVAAVIIIRKKRK